MVYTWDGDGIDFWACRDEADAEGRRFGAVLAAQPEMELAKLTLVGHSLGARVVVRALATHGNAVVNAEKGHLVALFGAEDLVVVHTRDATLVCPKASSDGLKALVRAIGEDPATAAFVR